MSEVSCDKFSPPLRSPLCCAPIHEEPQRLQWARIFFALLLPALVAKFAMVWVDAMQRADAEWLVQLVGRAAFFLWGGELLSSFALSLVCLGAVLVFAYFGAPRCGRRLVDLVILGHALFCGAAFAYHLQEGDVLTCELAALVELQGEAVGLGESLSAAVGATPVLVTLACIAFAHLAYVRTGPRFWGARHRTVATLLGLFALEAVLSIFLVPAMVSGRVPIRFKSHGLERAPLIELSSSCLSPWLARAMLSEHAHVENVDYRTPRGASPKDESAWGSRSARTDVVMLVLESVSDPLAFGGGYSMPYVESLLVRPDVMHLGTHYSTYSLTTKSMFSILTGELPDPRYASVVGRRPNLAVETLPEVLKNSGYESWLLSSQDLSFDRQAPFYERGRFDHIEDDENIAFRDTWRGGWGIDDARTIERGFEVLDAADAKREHPVFVVMQTQAAHHPFVTPDTRESEANRERYWEALGYLDRRVEQLVSGLEARGRLERTLVVVVSDHGVGFGVHRGRNVAEENVRSLAFLMGPQLIGARAQRAQVSSHIDLAPTVLGLLGIPAICATLGRDLSRGGPSKVVFFAGRPPKSQLGLRDGRWKFVLERGVGRLYELEADPGETEDLAREHSDRVALYTHWLADWSAHTRWRFAHYPRVRAEASCER